MGITPNRPVVNVRAWLRDSSEEALAPHQQMVLIRALAAYATLTGEVTERAVMGADADDNEWLLLALQ